MSKAERVGRIFVDYLRNDLTATAVGPYSPRSRASAPVATPLDWSELAPDLDPASFTIRTVPDRMERLGGDPWEEMASVRQRLPADATS
jgi:DNA primase